MNSPKAVPRKKKGFCDCLMHRYTHPKRLDIIPCLGKDCECYPNYSSIKPAKELEYCKECAVMHHIGKHKPVTKELEWEKLINEAFEQIYSYGWERFKGESYPKKDGQVNVVKNRLIYNLKQLLEDLEIEHQKEMERTVKEERLVMLGEVRRTLGEVGMSCMADGLEIGEFLEALKEREK